MIKTWSIDIFDRFPVFGSGLKLMLEKEPDLFIQQVLQKECDLFRLLKKDLPHLLLIDAVYSPDGCVPLIRKVKRLFPDFKTLVVSSPDVFFFRIDEMITAGIEGLVFSDAEFDQLVAAIHVVLSGSTIFPEKVVNTSHSREMVQLQNIRKKPEDRQPVLTSREVEVLKFFSGGLTAKEIGSRLFISPRTVETHKNNIMAKFHFRNSADLVKYALLNRII